MYHTIHKDVSAFFGIKEKLIQEYLQDVVGKDASIVLVYNGLPKSRGTITLKSSSPFDQPIIEPNYFKDPNDMKVMVDGNINILNMK